MIFFIIITFLFLHIILWRQFKPKKPQQTLTKLALLVFLAFYSVSTWQDLLIFILFYLLYLCLYSGIEQQSLSLWIMRILSSKKCSFEELYSQMPKTMLQERMKEAKKIWFDGDQISSKAIVMIKFFHYFRIIFKLPRGG